MAETKKTNEICEEIIERIANGEPLRQICRDQHMPHYTTFYDWLAADADLTLRFARARDFGEDEIAQRTRETARGKGESTGDVQRDKLIIDTDLKLLAKWSPKRWGDAVNLKHSNPDGGPVQVETRSAEELAREILFDVAKPQKKD